MRRGSILLFIWLLAAMLAAHASGHPKQRLNALFERAEQSYLMDDFELLKSYLGDYRKLLYEEGDQLGDSLDIYLAYYYKICGAYYYGRTEKVGYFFHESESAYQKCLQIFAKRLSERNVITLHEELAQLYYKVNCYDAALQQLDTIFNYYDDHLNNLGITSYEPDYYRTLSQLAICNARLGNFDIALKQIEEAQKYFKEQNSEFYYETLRREGKILMLQADSLGSTRYREARKCYERYVKEEFNTIVQRLDTMNSARRAQHWLATHKFLYDCYRLGYHAPEMLYDLALFSKGFLLAYENEPRTKQVRWQHVRKKLGAKDCAIEFVQYFGHNDEKRMGCLVLRNSGRPHFVDLFSTDSLLELELGPLYTVGDAFNEKKAEIKDTLYRDPRLPGLVWSRQLMEIIGDAEKVYFCPDGLIHQWAIEYLMPDSLKECYRLSSTRNLVQRPAPFKMQNAVLCGGMSYGAAYNPTGTDNDYMAFRMLRVRGMTTVYNLPDTRMEVDSIYAIRHNSRDTLLVDEKATDTGLIQLLRHSQYDIVHLTTHGFYIGMIDIHNDLRPLTEDLSLSRCGMLFAGARKTLNDDNFDDSHDDAVLSGKELAQQDFSKTELVVLNCCQTGQGRLTEDGIYGLQRALKQAGANAMLISLWNLDAYSSAIYLRYFYEELQRRPPKDMNLHKVLNIARNRLMNHKRIVLDRDMKWVTLQYDAPKHVCPFILIDAL